MLSETFNGCKIRVKAGRKNDWGHMTATVNGESVGVVEKMDEAKAVVEIKALLADIHSKPVDGDRWLPHYYAPGTYELCDEGIHAREIGGLCRHSWCVGQRAAK